MYERLLLVFVVILFVWVGLLLMKRQQFLLSNGASKHLDHPSNTPTIVYFWSDGCSVCKDTQKPILEHAVAEFAADGLALVAYNASEAPDTAKKWGVRTVPTTFLIDSAGAIRHINNGLVVAGELRRQLEPMMVQCKKSE